jgi:hypothetical protein
MCPICPHVGSVLARVLEPGRGGLVKSGWIRGAAGTVVAKLARQVSSQWSGPLAPSLEPGSGSPWRPRHTP